MKRYLVFNFDRYYPSGGMNDFSFSFETKEEFEENFRSGYDRYQIFDTRDGELVDGGYMTEEEVNEWIAENI